MNQQTLSAFIWAVADLLRGDYKQSDYGKVILRQTLGGLRCTRCGRSWWDRLLKESNCFFKFCHRQ